LRNTLNEGLPLEDGHSHLLVGAILKLPRLRSDVLLKVAKQKSAAG